MTTRSDGATDGATRKAVVGVSDHAGWAVLMTVEAGGRILDRRRVSLIDEGLPALVHHHEAQALPVPAAEELVERVRLSAERHAMAALDRLSTEVPSRISAIALRECPSLPPTVAERIASYYAQTRADGVMYREALAGAAAQKGWAVHWYDKRSVLAKATEVLGGDVEQLLREAGAALGPPWQIDHRLATAAALAASCEVAPARR